MSEKKIAETPREHFMQAAADELARFVRKEIAFQKAERDEPAMKPRLPISHGNRETTHNRARK